MEPLAVSDAIRRTIWFEGRVQGVGFRYTTREVAGQFGVTGYVRNLPDGRVEAMVEGERREVDRFIGAVQDAMGSCIYGLEQQDGPAMGEFVDFRIRH